MITLQGMKEYGYADDETFQTRIALMCLNAAKSYLAKADVKESEDPLYEHAVYRLAIHWYDNRAVETIGQVRGAMQYGIDSLINQLRYTPAGEGKSYTPVTLGD